MLHYRLKGQEEYTQELMKNCFEGIHVKEFILFYGDELDCYTEETTPDSTVKTSGQWVLTPGTASLDGTGRYQLLNRIIRARKEQDEETARRELDNYRQLDYLTKEVFTLI